MFVCRVSKPVCRQTRLDDKRDYSNPFVVVCRRVLNDTRAKPAPRKGFPFVICVTPIGGKRVDTPPHKWKPVRHLICRILGLSNGRSKLKSKHN